MAGTFTINDSTVVGSTIDGTAGKLVSIEMSTAPARGKHVKTHDSGSNLPTGGTFCLSDNNKKPLFNWDMLGAAPGVLMRDGKGTYTKLVFNSTVQGAVFTVVTQ
jgi:hypothetical protein